MTCTSREPPAARMTELMTEPRTNSLSRLRWVAPITSWVAFSARATWTRAGATSAPTTSTNRPPRSSSRARLLDQTLRAGAGQAVVGADVHADQLGLGPHGHAGGPPDEDGTAAASR